MFLILLPFVFADFKIKHLLPDSEQERNSTFPIWDSKLSADARVASAQSKNVKVAIKVLMKNFVQVCGWFIS